MTEQEIYDRLDVLKAQMSEIRKEMKELTDSLPNKYIIQRTWKETWSYNGGSMTKGFVQYCSRCGSQDHTFVSHRRDWEGNHTFKSRRDAQSLLDFIIQDNRMGKDFLEKYLHYEIVPL